MQPLLAVASLVAALAVAVNSETAYILAPVNHDPRILTTGWGWRPVKTVSIALPSITRGWGWKPRPKGVSIGVYGGIRIGPKQQGWGQPQKQGWGWQPPKQHGWGWQPPKQQGWGWQAPKQQGWGWQPKGWGWGDDSDEEDDYRSTVPALLYDNAGYESSSEEVADDDLSGSVESEEADSAEADSPLDLRNAIAYDPIYV